MLLTVGYARMTPRQLADIVAGLTATLIDVRSKPMSRKPGFNRNALEDLLGSCYEWWGDGLGGLKGASGIDPDAIQAVRKRSRSKNLMLMCLEEAPGDCHRHTLICAPHFPNARHIFRDHCVTARELQRIIEADRYDYQPCCRLNDLIASPCEPRGAQRNIR